MFGWSRVLVDVRALVVVVAVVVAVVVVVVVCSEAGAVVEGEKATRTPSASLKSQGVFRSRRSTRYSPTPSPTCLCRRTRTRTFAHVHEIVAIDSCLGVSTRRWSELHEGVECFMDGLFPSWATRKPDWGETTIADPSNKPA